MPAPIDNLRRLIDVLAPAAGIDPAALRAAARELIEILDRPEPDPRRVATFGLGHAIARLKAKRIPRAVICARLGISIHQYHRAALAVSRDSRYPLARDSAQPTVSKGTV